MIKKTAPIIAPAPKKDGRTVVTCPRCVGKSTSGLPLQPVESAILKAEDALK